MEHKYKYPCLFMSGSVINLVEEIKAQPSQVISAIVRKSPCHMLKDRSRKYPLACGRTVTKRILPDVEVVYKIVRTTGLSSLQGQMLMGHGGH